MSWMDKPMDKRNSKDNLVKRVSELTARLNTVYEAGYDGIHYVGRANYQERENEAIRKLNTAMFPDDSG